MSGVFDRVVITGGAGMLARALHENLRSQGVEPIVLTRGQCDLENDAHIASLFEHQPTLLLNCAAHTKVDQCEVEQDRADAINGYAVGKMARHSKHHKTHFVHVSTDFVFGGQPRGSERPYQPGDLTGPLSAYGRSKLLGETELQMNAPSKWLIVRTAWVYGRGGANFPRTMVTAARAGKPLSVVEDQVGSPTYTPDLAEAILALVQANATGVYHVSNAGQTNWREFAAATMEAFKIDHPVAGLSSADWAKIKPNAAARPSYSLLDLSAYEKATGKQMRPWREGLEAYAREVEEKGF